MPCYRIKPRPMTLGEAQELLIGERRAFRPDPRDGALNNARRKSAWERAQAEDIVGDAPFFLCGRDLEIVMCRESGCEREHEVLCDWPMGRGKTCDLPLCADHAHHVGEDRDFCRVHFALFVEATRTERVNPWPPKRSR